METKEFEKELLVIALEHHEQQRPSGVNQPKVNEDLAQHVLNLLESRLKAYDEWICCHLNKMGCLLWGNGNYHTCCNLNYAELKKLLAVKCAESLPTSLDIYWQVIAPNTDRRCRIEYQLFAVIMTVKIEKFLGCTVVDYHISVVDSGGIHRAEATHLNTLQSMLKGAYRAGPFCLTTGKC